MSQNKEDQFDGTFASPNKIFLNKLPEETQNDAKEIQSQLEGNFHLFEKLWY